MYPFAHPMHGPLRILIIDDNEADRAMVRRALDASGVGSELTEVSDAAEGIRALKGAAVGDNAAGGGAPAGLFDCVLLDYHLPDTDGLAVLRAVRRVSPFTPVILLTRQGDEERAVEMMKSGAADYLYKQRLSADLLSHAVRHAVRLRRAQAEADRARVVSAETERRFRHMADAAPVLLWVADEDNRGIYFNQGWLDFTGRTLEQEAGFGWAEAIHPDDRERALSTCAAHAAARQKFQMEFRLRRHDGQYRWVLDTAAPRVLADGTFAGYVGSCVDITERKAAEQERDEVLAREQRAAASSRFLAEASVVLGSSLDYETTLASVAKLAVPQIADFCAVDMPAADGRIRRLAMAYADERRGAIARELAARYPLRSDDPSPFGVPHVLRTGQPELHPEVPDAVLTAAAKDAEQLRMFREAGMVSGLIVPMTARGRTLGAITLVTAESGRKLTADDLALAEDLARRAATAVDNARLYREARDAFSSKERTMALLDTVLAAAPVGFAFFDSHLRFVRLNGALASYNGAVPEAHFGRTPSQVNARLGEKIEPNLRRVLETQKPVLDVELHGGEAAKPGERREFLASYYPVRSLAGEVLGVGAVLADITDRKGAEQRLLEETRTTEALYRITRRLAAELDVSRLVQTVTDEATALTGAGFGAFFYNVLSEQGESYTLYTLSGAPREAFEKFPMPRNTEIFAPTFRGEGIVRSDDITKDPRYGKSEPHRGMPQGHLPVRSYLAAPVVSRSGDVIGGLFFGHEQAGVFNERDEKLVAGIAAQAAVAIDNARLYEALRGSERQYRFLAESIPQIVWTAAPDGRIDYFNQRWHEFTGPAPDQSKGNAWEQVIHPDDAQNCADRWAASVRTGETYEVEYRLRRADGAFRWQLGRAVPFRDPSGGIARWFGTSTDIHDRKQAEQELRKSLAERTRAEEALRVSRERLDLVVEASALGFWYCDLPFDKLVWSDRCKEHFGLPPDAAVTIGTFFERIHPEDREPTREAIERSIRDRSRYDIVYRTVAAPDAAEPGRMRYVRAMGRAFYDPAGTPRRFDGVTVDVTAQKHGEEELKPAKEAAERSAAAAEAANAAKDQFLAVLSHELRTPLTPVLSTVQAMESEPGLSGDVRESLEMIKRNVELEARLIDDLLDLTRIAKNKLELNLQTVDVSRALEGAVEICRGDIEGKGLRLELDLCAARRHVRADAARMQQVFWNLIKNAVKFTPAGGTISVRTSNADAGDPDERGRGEGGEGGSASATSPRHDDGSSERLPAPPHLIVEVRDTGIGIEPDVLPRIFDAFEQGERSITRRFGGLGLGLAISRALIDMQGGHLTAASDGKGRGAVFAVEMPTVEPAAETPRRQSPPGSVAGAPAGGHGERPAAEAGAGLRILLVEDHDDTAKAMRRLLRRRGFDVSIATCVAEALDAFARQRFDLLISDIGLNDGSGLDLLRQIRARIESTAPAPANGSAPAQPGITAIALSGFGMEEDVARSREAGFFAHLTKPINWDLLEATILRAIGQPSCGGGNGKT